jgi:hypothetical protein
MCTQPYDQPPYTDEREELDQARNRAYAALSTAADRIGSNNYHRGLTAHVRAGRKAWTYRYEPSAAHRLIVGAMPDVLAGRITPDEAMAYLHDYEVMRERMGDDA